MGVAVFTGSAGRTTYRETTIWCPECGTSFGGRWLSALDADTDAGVLSAVLDGGLSAVSRAVCPGCEAAYVIDEPVTVHRATAAQLLLVVPRSRSHRAHQARAALLVAVAQDPGERPPPYAFDPVLVRGIAGLRELLRDATRTSARPIPEPEPRAESPPPEGLTDPRGSALLAAFKGDAPDHAAVDAWDEQWSLDGSTESATEHEPTRVSRIPTPRARLPEGDDRLLAIDDGDVLALFRVPGPTEGGGILTDSTLRFQLHRTPAGLVACLTLVGADGQAPAVWTIDPTDAESAFLERLSRRFSVTVDTVDPEGMLVERRVFDPPLARNVAVARALIDRAGGSPAAARAAVDAGELELVGQLKHNFREDTFATCRTASEANLALGIVGFWTEPEREHYLLWVQSFPRVWFEAIVRRVLSVALDFGLMPAPHLETRALELGLAPDARALVSRALASFAESNLSVSRQHNDLDPLDNYENWERLLTRAEALGMVVDASIRGLAFNAMEAARRAVEAADASEEAIELDLDDDAIELESIDEPTARLVRDGDQTTDRLDDLIDTALIRLLDDPTQRAGAAAELLRRGDALYAPTIGDAVLAMNDAELARVLPAGIDMAQALASHLLPALHGTNPVLRRAVTLFLAEARRSEVAPALVDQLLDAQDPGWPILASALARYGDEIRHLVAGLPLDGGAMERVARVLGGLPDEIRRTVYDAGARQSALVRRCLERAEVLAAESPHPGSFARRLDEALALMVVGDTTASVSIGARGDDGAIDFE